MTQSKPLTLGELEDGDYFIAFPLDGDDRGHGGFRGGNYLMLKTPNADKDRYRYRRSVGLIYSWGPASMQVLKVLVGR